MEKVAVVGTNVPTVESVLRKAGFTIDRQRPDIAVSFGGDGSALLAEALYPGLPRLTIKSSQTCDTAPSKDAYEDDISKIFLKLKEGRYAIVKESKVEASVDGDRTRCITGLNEINVAHAKPIQAMRFEVEIDGKVVERCVIGDGVIVATPYGSTGYFQAITGRKFSKGLGIALNNSNLGKLFWFVTDSAQVRIRVLRGPALLCADNNSNMMPLKDGESITVGISKEKAKLIKLAGEDRKIVMIGKRGKDTGKNK